MDYVDVETEDEEYFVTTIDETDDVSSGVTLLEGARGQGMAGCPID